MGCEHFLGTMLNEAAGLEFRSTEFATHLRDCSACSARFRDLLKTMDLLDEWKAPEPSPYFDARLSAKLHEASSSTRTSWWSFLPRPALALGLATLVLAGVLTVRYTTNPPKTPTQADIDIVPGSAVADLQTLEEVENVSGDSDLLDLLAPEQHNVDTRAETGHSILGK